VQYGPVEQATDPSTSAENEEKTSFAATVSVAVIGTSPTPEGVPKEDSLQVFRL
jgi:hypothetical protein